MKTHPVAVATIALTFAALAVWGCARPGPSAHKLTIKGSDTMVHLVTDWAEAYMKAHPEAQISVTGGGSGTGIASMINGTTELAMSSRDIKEEEKSLAEKRKIQFEEIVVGRDGIAVVVYPENPLDELSMDQLRQIFNGTLENWSQLGGPDHALQALSRESNSGTYVFFNEHVLQKDDFGPRVRLMPSSAAIVQSVGQDRWSIGYVGLGYTEEAPVKVLGVKADTRSPAIKPALETVSDGSYPIARPLFLYSNGKPTGLAADFVQFVLSPEGQKIVEETGYIPLQ